MSCPMTTESVFTSARHCLAPLCPPVPGWDPVQETRDLASGGGNTHMACSSTATSTRKASSGRIHDLVRYKPGKTCDNRPFEEWLRSCEWERSGSSSIGRVEYEVEVDGERRKGHFKARKNLALDVYAFEDLVQRVREHNTQDNRALVKSEFGKDTVGGVSTAGSLPAAGIFVQRIRQCVPLPGPATRWKNRWRPKCGEPSGRSCGWPLGPLRFRATSLGLTTSQPQTSWSHSNR
ncbi:hypothetical protein MTO96_052188 [Rhipicephalus appendiculatus]